MLSGEKILITGASGLVGMELARDLAVDNEVWGLSRYLEPEQREGAVNAYAVTRADVEAIGVKPIAADLLGSLDHVPTDFTYVLHLAHTRLGIDRLQEAVEINSQAGGRILHHCRRAKAALVASSTAVYSFPEDVWHKLKETDPIGGAKPPFHNATSPASKQALEAVSQFCAAEFSLPTIIMRLNVLYGPRGGFPTRDLHRIAAGETIKHFGDPYPHSPIHLSDMSSQIEALMDAAHTKANIVNWCGDEVVTQRQWCELAAELSGRGLNVESKPNAPGNSADPEKRRSITGPCNIDIRTGLSEVFAAHHIHQSEIDRQFGRISSTG